MHDDSDAINRLMNQYVEYFDDGHLPEFAALFARGTLRFEGMGEYTGSAAVLEFIDRMVILYDGKPYTNHLMHNVTIDVDPEVGTATARSYVSILQSLPDVPLRPIVTGRYADRFTRTDGEWHFVERRARGGLRGDLSRHLRLEKLG